jgi:capsular polysaccharide biosynthesis protein
MKAFADRIAGLTQQVTASQQIITTQKHYQGTMKQRLTEVESDIADFEETIREIDFEKANMNELLFFKATLNSLKEQLLATEMESNAAEKIIGEQEEIIREARKEIANIEGYVGLSRNTELRTRPILPDEPVRPEKTLNIIVATLLGLLITTSYVFLAHYVRQED